MTTLTVDGVEFRVVERPKWSTERAVRTPLRGGRPGDYAVQPVASFVEAVVELTRDRRVEQLNKAGVKVMLALDGGGLVEGDDMWCIGDLVVRDGRVRVRYEGNEVWELDTSA